ncbi:MAG: hypothetical protein WCO94_04885 [Verrucomicrobiota bacterium]
MPFWKVEAFVKSLRATGYAGRTVFFASLLTRSTEMELLASSVEIERFLFLGRHVRQRLASPWSLWRKYFALPQPEWMRDFVARRVLHLFYLRHLIYLRFLERNPGIQRILMCDCRDVYFQRDPFTDWPGPGLHAFQETESVSVGECEHHRRWITLLAGEDILEQLSEFPRVCAGAILADRDSAIAFLTKMVEMTYSALSLEAHDGDQGLFNILVRQNRIPNIVVHRNGESSVYTHPGITSEAVRSDRDGFVIRPDGSPVPVLHQYDRNLEIAKPLLRKLGL